MSISNSEIYRERILGPHRIAPNRSSLSLSYTLYLVLAQAIIKNPHNVNSLTRYIREVQSRVLLNALSNGAVYGGLGSGGGTFHTTPTAACKTHDERTAAVLVVLKEVCVDDPWMEGVGRHSSS